MEGGGAGWLTCRHGNKVENFLLDDSARCITADNIFSIRPGIGRPVHIYAYARPRCQMGYMQLPRRVSHWLETLENGPVPEHRFWMVPSLFLIREMYMLLYMETDPWTIWRGSRGRVIPRVITAIRDISS